MKRAALFANRFSFFLKNQYRVGIFFTLLVGLGAFVCTAFNAEMPDPNPPTYNDYAGTEACLSCHKEICENQLHTAHFLTSAPATAQTIKGSFAQGKNEFAYNAFMKVKMDSIDGIFFQQAFVNDAPFESRAFDISIGSGSKGQTYLYWDGPNLFQLPVSYYTPLNAWCNSPGYASSMINFERRINTRCMECHGTYAKAIVDNGIAVFDRTKIIYGIQCERCHGAAAQHVAYQKAHPTDTTGQFILHIKSLTRQQKLDACALCHSGIRSEVQPAFTFQTGEKLEDYSKPSYNQDSVSMLDVHGNQFGLLTSSKCFKMSQMECSSCHNTHNTETGNTVLFSQRCQTCHTNVSHSFQTAKNVKMIQANCIDCHMPSLPSSKITLMLSGKQKTSPDYVTTHHIAVYPELTKAFLKKD